MGSVANRLNNSKGCGAAMRAAPIALLGEDAFAYVVGTGALTHGHPSGYLSAGAHAHLIYLLLGGGWRGEEALAIALCTALVAKDMADGLLLAVNHTGDSDSTGSMCGNILGAMHGVDAIPAHLLAELELRDVIEQLTRDLLTEYGDNPPDTEEWRVRYPPW